MNHSFIELNPTLQSLAGEPCHPVRPLVASVPPHGDEHFQLFIAARLDFSPVSFQTKRKETPALIHPNTRGGALYVDPV